MNEIPKKHELYTFASFCDIFCFMISVDEPFLDDTWLPSWISQANGRQKGVVLTDFGISTLVTNEAPAEGDDQWMIYIYIYRLF